MTVDTIGEVAHQNDCLWVNMDDVPVLLTSILPDDLGGRVHYRKHINFRPTIVNRDAR